MGLGKKAMFNISVLCKPFVCRHNETNDTIFYTGTRCHDKDFSRSRFHQHSAMQLQINFDNVENVDCKRH